MSRVGVSIVIIPEASVVARGQLPSGEKRHLRLYFRSFADDFQ